MKLNWRIENDRLKAESENGLIFIIMPCDTGPVPGWIAYCGKLPLLQHRTKDGNDYSYVTPLGDCIYACESFADEDAAFQPHPTGIVEWKI